VSAALEGALLGVPSVALSAPRIKDTCDFTTAAEVAAVVTRAVLEQGMPKFTFLNVNVPVGASRGMRVTVQGRRNHETVVSERMDPRHRAYYWIEEGENFWESQERSDYRAVLDGFTSVTPLKPDMTAYEALDYADSLRLSTIPSTLVP
jgi:5'-nucleotidase